MGFFTLDDRLNPGHIERLRKVELVIIGVIIICKSCFKTCKT
jgi:hypothetical protein